jgi:hypothetical protein
MLAWSVGNAVQMLGHELVCCNALIAQLSASKDHFVPAACKADVHRQGRLAIVERIWWST